jgi:hypothetical protein
MHGEWYVSQLVIAFNHGCGLNVNWHKSQNGQRKTYNHRVIETLS